MRKLSILALIIVSTFAASAQWFSLGVKTGYSTTLAKDQKSTDVFKVSSNLQNGFNLGVYARMGRRFYAQPEIIYNYYSYNSQISVGGVDIADTKKYKISTFDIPVLAGFSIINNKSFKLRLMAGPKFSFNAGSTKVSDWNSFSETVRAARVGLDCGVGIDVWRITLDFRYNLMPDIYKYKDLNGETMKNSPLNAFQISAGFRIFGNNIK